MKADSARFDCGPSFFLIRGQLHGCNCCQHSKIASLAGHNLQKRAIFFPVMLKVAVVFVFVVLACEDLGRMFDNSFPA